VTTSGCRRRPTFTPSPPRFVSVVLQSRAGLMTGADGAAYGLRLAGLVKSGRDLVGRSAGGKRRQHRAVVRALSAIPPADLRSRNATHPPHPPALRPLRLP